MEINQLKLERFNGDEVFDIINASVYFSLDKTMLSLDFETGECVSVPLEDTNVNGGLSGEFWIYDLKVSNLKELEGMSFYIDDGNNNDAYDTCSTLYYRAHQSISKNKIEFLKFYQDYVDVKIIANTCDVNYYDGSKPEAKIEIRANFNYKD